MKKIILTGALMLMVVVSGSAMAEWIRVHGNEKVTVYADPSTLRKRLYIVKIATLFDFKAENALSDGNQYLSTMRVTEFNCRENQQRMVGYSIYAGKMGRGKLLESGSDPQEWKSVSKTTIAMDMKDFACDRDF